MKNKAPVWQVPVMLAGIVLLLGGIFIQTLVEQEWAVTAGVISLTVGTLLYAFSLSRMLYAQSKNSGDAVNPAPGAAERSKSIRDRAGYITNIVMIPVLAAVALACVFLEMLVAALLIAAALIIQAAALLLVGAMLSKRKSP